MRRRFAVAVVGTLGTAACASVIGLGDYEVGGDDAGPTDGAAPVTSGSSSKPTPTPPPVDATVTPIVDAGPRVCATAHTFCDDFDDSAPLLPRWSSNEQSAAPLRLDTTIFASGPRALTTTFPPSNNERSALWKDIKFTNGKIHVEVDYRMDPGEMAGSQDIAPVEIDMYPGPTNYIKAHGYYISVRNSQTLLYYFATPSSGDAYYKSATFDIPHGAWHHFTFDYEPSTRMGHMQVDGSDTTIEALPGPTPTTGYLGVGATYLINTKGTWTTHIDNVILDLPP